MLNEVSTSQQNILRLHYEDQSVYIVQENDIFILLGCYAAWIGS